MTGFPRSLKLKGLCAALIVLSSAIMVVSHAQTLTGSKPISPSVERVSLARRMLVETGYLDAMSGQFQDAFVPSMTAKLIERVGVDYRPEYDTALQTAISDELKSRNYPDGIANLYASVFNDQELRDMIAFAETPTGKKMRSEASALRFLFLEGFSAVQIGFEEGATARLCKAQPAACVHLTSEPTTTTKTQQTPLPAPHP